MSQHLVSASNIFEADDLDILDVAVPEWKTPEGEPGILTLQEMAADRSVLFSHMMSDPANSADGMFIILIFSAVHPETKELLFTPDDIPALRKKNLDVLNRLQRICLRLNGMGPEARAELKNVSSEGASGDSPSSLPSQSAELT